MMTLPKINRRTWLALWAQGRRRNRLRFGHPALLPAPVLRAAYPDLLRWDWDLANPHKWNVWTSLNGGASWFLTEDYWMYGDARQFAPDGGSEFYFIVGVDAAGVEITERSNWIRPDDAVPPVPQSVIGLQLWTRVESLAGMSDGDRVATWPDESGHETHLAQSNFDYRPVYRSNDLGQPAVMFDGTDDLLTSVASVFKPDQHTIFVVAMPLATGENDILGTGGSGDGDALLMLYSNHLRGHAWRGSDANMLDGVTPIDTSTLAVFEQVVSETDITLRLDGSSEAAMGVNGTPANTRKWVTLGSRSTGTNFSGYILAVLVYDRALTETEANTIRQYLIDTYAVPTPYTPESWWHLVVTKSATLFCFYLNGALVGWADVSAFPYVSLMDQIAIGTGGSGLIDEVGCWRRALSADEVAQLYNYGSGLPFENF